ncbi:hypothetical protein E4U55_002089 [Claviceps digitariae]|nr:hypothetical protein E4U55_002089 [Claviceps digitariae]
MALSQPPFGKVRQVISALDIPAAGFKVDPVGITGCETVSSYNWMQGPGASITVPGMPARWTPILEPIELSEDSGTYHRDRNAARSPKYPLEPAVQSILDIEADTLSLGNVDVFGCATTLGNLLRFLRGQASSFRMLVEVVGSTVHLVRRERSPFETIPGVRGYGHSFPNAYTTWDPEVRGSSSHQRIISYRLGGLGLLCLFEGDGYLPMDSHSSLSTAHEKQTAESSTAPDADDLLVSGLSVSPQELISKDASAVIGSEPELKVSIAGEIIGQDRVFELKTRSIKRQCDQDVFMATQLPRLWLRQVPNLILAYHNSGTFTDIRVMDIRSQLKEWEEREVPLLKKFVSLLQKIVQAARDGLEGGSRIEITYEEGAEQICIREQEPDLPAILPPATLTRWESWLVRREVSDSNSDDSFIEIYGESDDESDDSYDYTVCDDECGYCGHCR